MGTAGAEISKEGSKLALNVGLAPDPPAAGFCSCSPKMDMEEAPPGAWITLVVGRLTLMLVLFMVDMVSFGMA